GNGRKGKPWPWLPCDEWLCLALPVRALVPVTVVCLGLFVVSVVGNILMVLVICGYRDVKTTTNLCLGSMAVSDLLVLLGLPFHLYCLWHSRPWIFGQLWWRLSHYLSEGCADCATLHTTTLTVERCLAICFPLKAKVVNTKCLVKAVIGVLWAFAILSASPFFFLDDVEQPDNHTDFSCECKPTPQAAESGLLATMFWVTTSYFVLPVICLNVLCSFTGQELWRGSAHLQGPNMVLRDKGHCQTIKILAVVVLAFVICWLPFHIGRIVFINTQDSRMMLFSQYFNIFALQLFYLRASINPIPNNLILKKYRAA
ncbi:MTLR protein, partial [Fregata magnificens]|nr:MTLR protein [Fregata magnificens]